ncbi:hypothetical protein B0A52_09637 [Exophiala mesophila]|uniref:Major facilitator superfamily (MFS) profile domain-containing protein n=1 Tax=Exophiala mesophila TaxID=212818 RepID=A0A438MS02_EXOME|nr:hypothetical protein B0A52_09637 [Exophiala mesophila]
MGLTGGPLQLLINVTGGFAFLLFGYDQGVMGGLLTLPPFQERFNYPSPTMQGFMVASYDLGCLAGAILCFCYANLTGRRWTIALGCIVLLIGAALQTASFSVAQFNVGRIVAGIGVGAISATASTNVHQRMLQTWKERNHDLYPGIVISGFTNYGLVFETPSLEGTDGQWRAALGFQMIFPIFVFALLPFCPESPRWLASRGASLKKVASVLALLEGKGATDTTPHILGLANEIVLVAQHEAELEESTTWHEAFSGGELQNGRRLLLSGVVVGLLQQITGVNAIVYYAPVVFQEAGLSPRMAFIMGGVGSIAMLVGTLLPILWIERAGRRKTLLISAWLEVLTMGGIAASIGWGINHPQHKESSGWAATAFIFAFEFAFGLGCCPIPFVFAPEVNSLRSRHKGNAVQSMGLWAGCFLIVMVSPVGVANLSWRFYLIWMIITLAWIPMVWAFVPETAGRSLEQMDYFFKKYQDKWYIRDVAYEWVEREDVMTDHADDKEAALEIEHPVKVDSPSIDGNRAVV